MAKQSGLGDNCYVDGYDLSGDIGSLSRIAGPQGVLDLTSIKQLAFERRGGTRDGAIEFVSYFNPGQDEAHPVLSALPAANRVVSYFRGSGIGSPCASLVGKQINYDGTRGQDGAFTFNVQAQANGYGLEWGTQLTAGIRTDTLATSGSSADFGAGTSFGLQAYLHVFSFTGTDATITIQSSSDNGVGDSFSNVTGGSFTQVTGARVSQRIATASNASIERYLRVVTTTTGGFSSLSFAVMVVKNEIETAW